MGRQDLRYDYIDTMDALIPGGNDMKTTYDDPRKQPDVIDHGYYTLNKSPKEFRLLANYIKNSI